MSETKGMSFKEALKILNIEDYGERIFNSNSHGELFHCYDYIIMAKAFRDDAVWFREWFLVVIKWAEETWERPESIFQHITKVLLEAIEENKENRK